LHPLGILIAILTHPAEHGSGIEGTPIDPYGKAGFYICDEVLK
jgi:hypothetical protein